MITSILLNQEEKQEVPSTTNNTSSIHMTTAVVAAAAVEGAAVTNAILLEAAKGGSFSTITAAAAGRDDDHDAVANTAAAAALLSVAVAGAAAVATLPAAAAAAVVVVDLLASSTAATTTTNDNDDDAPARTPAMVVPNTIDKNSSFQSSVRQPAVAAGGGGVLSPLEELIIQFPVLLAKGNAENAKNIDLSIQSLDILICEISKLDYNRANTGISTGFASSFCQRVWVDLSDSSFPQYQTLPDVNKLHDCCCWATTTTATTSLQPVSSSSIPLPSPLVALGYLLAIKETWNQRKAWAMAETLQDKKRFCSCIGAWEHSKADILHLLANQTLEALMVAEADKCLRNRYNSPKLLCDWDQLYSPDSCPTPAELTQSYMEETPLRLLDTRDEYIAAYLEQIMAAESTIDICLCYIFARDPFVRYLLLDVLPFIVQQKSVRVRILIEQMVLEGEAIKMFFQGLQSTDTMTEAGHVDSSSTAEKNNKRKKDADWLNSFRWKLPPNCPPFIKAEKAIHSSVGLIGEVLKESSKSPHNPIHIKYWFARDKNVKYRIKSHVKCHVFDGNGVRGMAVAGGSNFAPRCGSTDCDFLIGGRIANMYQQLFDKMFDSMTFSNPLDKSTLDDSSSSVTASTSSTLYADSSNHSCPSTTMEVQDEEDVTQSTERGHLLDHSCSYLNNNNSATRRTTKIEWTDPSCKVSFLNSVPSSDGEDSILRCILGAIKTAEKSVTMCMGHSNVPAVMREALVEASYRGVKVSLLVNSFYSCDLRNGQRDLFRSLMKLLEIAPSIELWVVTVPSRRSGFQAPVNSSVAPNEAPAFLHSKYVVVDSKWSAVGSWNLWTRAAFYEMEAEIFVHSTFVAASLEEKFDREKRQFATILQRPEDCIHYNPTGCSICHQFGPFFVDEVPAVVVS